MASYIVASTAPWHGDLAQRLRDRTGRQFVAIATLPQLETALREQGDVRFIFFAHWSTRIPPAIWSAYECVIFHMTDVPFGRGGSPLQNLIVRGFRETKLTALRCTAEMDAGPVYMKRPLTLDGSATEIFQRAARVIEDMAVAIVETEPRPVEQTGEVTVFRRRQPAESALDGAMTLDAVYDHIRMLDAEGYPPPFLEIGQLRLEFSGVTRHGGHLRASVTIRPANEPVSE